MAAKVKAGSAYIELTAESQKLIQGLNDASSKMRKFGSDMTTVGKSVAGVGAAITAPILGAAKQFASYGDQMAKASKRTGIAVESISALAFAAERGGSDITVLEASLKKMSQTIYTATNGSKASVDALNALGLSVKELQGLSPEEQFKAIGNALNAIEDPTKKAALAQIVFSESGLKLLPVLQNLNSELQKARDFGAVISAEDAKKAEELTDAINALKTAFRSLSLAIGAEVAPELTRMMNELAMATPAMRTFIRENGDLIVSMLKLGGVLIGAGGVIIGLGQLTIAMSSIVKSAAIAGKAVQALWVLCAAHPFVALGAAIIAAEVAIFKFATTTVDAQLKFYDMLESVDKFRESMAKLKGDIKTGVGAIDALKKLEKIDPFDEKDLADALEIIETLEKKFGVTGIKIKVTDMGNIVDIPQAAKDKLILDNAPDVLEKYKNEITKLNEIIASPNAQKEQIEKARRDRDMLVKDIIGLYDQLDDAKRREKEARLNQFREESLKSKENIIVDERSDEIDASYAESIRGINDAISEQSNEIDAAYAESIRGMDDPVSADIPNIADQITEPVIDIVDSVRAAAESAMEQVRTSSAGTFSGGAALQALEGGIISVETRIANAAEATAKNTDKIAKLMKDQATNEDTFE